MPTVIQMFLTMFTCLSVSIIIFVAVSVLILSFSSSNDGVFNVFDLPVANSALIGTMIGAGHGLITGVLFCWKKPDSIFSGIWTTFIGTELFLLLVIAAFLLYQLPTISFTVSNISSLIVTFVLYCIIFTVVFLVPSAVIGVVNRFILKFLLFR